MMIHQTESAFICNPNLTRNDAGAELLLYDSSAKCVHTLNRTARAIWLLCAEPRTVEEITTELAAQVKGVDRATLHQDVEAVVIRFCEKGLLSKAQD